MLFQKIYLLAFIIDYRNAQRTGSHTLFSEADFCMANIVILYYTCMMCVASQVMLCQSVLLSFCMAAWLMYSHVAIINPCKACDLKKVRITALFTEESEWKYFPFSEDYQCQTTLKKSGPLWIWKEIVAQPLPLMFSYVTCKKLLT